MALPTERTLRLSTKVSKSRVKNRLVSEGAILSVLYCSSKRWGWLCAHGWVGASTYRFVPRHSLVMIEWRVPFVFESRPFLFPKRKPPLAFAAHSFLEIPPPAKKIRMRSGKARGRDARYSARGGIQHHHAIGAYERVSSHHALGACEVSRDFC